MVIKSFGGAKRTVQEVLDAISGESISPSSVTTDELSIGSDGPSTSFGDIGDSQALASGNIVYVGETTGRQTLDPSTTTSPIKDAIDAIYNNGEGGHVYLPPTTIQTDTGFDMRSGVYVHGFGSHVGKQVTTVERTTAGIHLVRYRDDASATGVLKGTLLHGIVFDGNSTTTLGTQAGACFYVGTEQTGAYIHRVLDVSATNFTDSFWLQDGKIYNMTFGPNIRTRNIDPESAAAGRAMVDGAPGGIQHSWVGTNELYGWGDAATHPSGTDCTAISFGGNIQIDHLNVGGAVNSLLHLQSKTATVNRIYLEPNDRVSADDLYLVRLDDFRRVWIGSIEIATADGTVDRGYRIATFPDSGSVGNAYLPEIVTGGSAAISGDQLRVYNCDIDGAFMYGGESADVNNDFGSALSSPVFCAGDGVWKTSTGVGYTASVDRKAGVSGLLVASNAALTLSSGSAIISTGVTTTPAYFTVHLDPSGNGNNAADVKCSARAFWDNSAGEYKIEVLEDGTSVGNPDIGIEVYQTA